MPASRILILEELSGKRVIDISSHEAHQTVALAIVNARWEEGFYAIRGEPSKPELTYDRVLGLPPGSIRDYGKQAWKRYREDMKAWEAEKQEHSRVEKCVVEKDGAGAIEILERRRLHEGEGFEIFEVQNSY